MRVLLIYFITIFLSNTVGALSGMGGGVIIKPVLDFLGFHSLNSIAFYSSVAVFVMSISSTYKQYQNGVQIEWKKAASISFGSLVGGMLGDLLLNQAIALAPNEEKVLTETQQINMQADELLKNHKKQQKEYRRRRR